MKTTLAAISLAVSMALAQSAANSITIDPNEYFAYIYASPPSAGMLGFHLFLSKRPCSKIAKKGWMYADEVTDKYEDHKPNCWRTASDNKDFVIVCWRTKDGEVSGICQPMAKRLFLDTKSLPSSAGF